MKIIFDEKIKCFLFHYKSIVIRFQLNGYIFNILQGERKNEKCIMRKTNNLE